MNVSVCRHPATFLVLVALILWSTVAGAQPPADSIPRLDNLLSTKVRGSDSGTTRVIIRMKGRGNRGLRTALESDGNPVLLEHPSINAVTARVSVAALRDLASNPLVESISTDAVVVATQWSQWSWGDSTLRGTLGLSVQSPGGRHVGVAVIDSGLEAGPEFGDRIEGFYDFTQNGIETSPSDDYGHGTHVAGLIAGDGELSWGRRYRGVAPRARLIALKVLDAHGAGTTSDVINAIEFATSNKDRLGIDVINLSLGHPIYEAAATDPLVQAVEAAVRAGIVVVTSGGNYGVSPATGQPGYAGILSPGNAPSAITVGAVKSLGTNSRTDDSVAAYSSRGPTWHEGLAKPDLVAPGHGLVAVAAKSSTLYVDNPSLRVDNSYLRLSGTSMAAGVVTGTVALILESHRTAFGDAPLTPNTVKAILQHTALRVRNENGVEYDHLTQGAGSVNPAGAIALAAHIDTSMPTGSRWLTSDVDAWTVIDNETLPWAENIVWSDALGRGEAVYFNEPAWGQNIVWGSNIIWGSSILFDDNIVWGSNSSWDDNIVWGSNLIGALNGGSTTWGMAADDPSLTVWETLDASAESMGSALTSP